MDKVWAYVKAVLPKISKAPLAVLEKIWFLVVLALHKAFVTVPARAWKAIVYWAKSAWSTLKAATHGLRVTLWRVGLFIAIGTRYYKNWSHLYQWLYERRYAKTPISVYATLKDLQTRIATCTWVADGWKELGDAFSSAGYIQNIINQGGARKIGDCDEFAMYNAAAIAESVRTGVWKDRAIKDTQIMTLGWFDAKGVRQGHNVCLISWADGKFSYVDYSSPSVDVASPHDVALQVVKNYGGTELLGWAVQGRDLSVLGVYWK